jgi:glucose-1-phosphate thymidylyltransferase
MKLLVLAAGYATRLYPLTLDRPKALLPVAGRPMVEHVVGRLGAIDDIDGVYLVTNAKFADQFRAWADAYDPARPGLAVTVIDDGTTSDETRLGAIGDIELVLRTQAVDDDLIVVASDNLFTEDLADFGAFCRGKNAAVVAVYDVGDLSEMRKYNSISVDEDGRVTFFEEKPERPTSTLTGIALYFYPRRVLPLVGRYLAEGNNPDQPGRLVEWLYTRTPVYAWPVPGRWYDIGSKASLREADRALGATP